MNKYKLQENIEKFAAATDDELYDREDGDWMVEADETFQAIEDFIKGSRGWRECSRRNEGTIAGFPFVSWESTQATRGQKRRPVSVIDLGEKRIILFEDIDRFDWTD